MIHWIIILILALNAGCGAPHTKSPPSDHFDGERFFNPDGDRHEKTLVDFLKWQLTAKREFWPDWMHIDQKKVAQARVTGLSVTFINHASALIQVDGVNILTDPIWSERTSPVTWFGPKRKKLPGVAFEDLPPIDIVIVSHNHYDHMDLPTLKKLSQKFQPKIIVGLGNVVHLSEINSSQIVELDWGAHFELGSVKIVFTPSQHWSRRTLTDRNKSLWGSFVIQGKKHKVYFAGDTGYASHFQKIGVSHGPFDLSLIPIGSYEPRWFMKTAHVNPHEAVQAHLDLSSKKSMGIHFGTFQLTDEGIDEPADNLKAALRSFNIGDSEFIIPENGDTINFSK